MRAPWSRSLKSPEQLESEKQERVRNRISVRNLFVYLGPALIVSMAYMDPGNYGTDIQSGASFAYDLLWAVWLANLMAMILQYLSGKLGIATGKDLARTRPRIPEVQEAHHSLLAGCGGGCGGDRPGRVPGYRHRAQPALRRPSPLRVHLRRGRRNHSPGADVKDAFGSSNTSSCSSFPIIAIGFLYQVIMIGPSLS